MTETYQFDVVMTCSGCSGAITRVLSKMTTIESFDVSLEDQKVVVHPGSKASGKGATFEEVEEKIRKTGKEIRKGEVVG